MTSFNAPPKLSRQMLMLTAAVVLLAATDVAFAKDGGHSNGRGGMASSASSRNGGSHDRMSSRESNRDRDRGDKHSERHENKGKEHADNTHKEKSNTPGATTVNNAPPAPGTGGRNTIHPVISPPPAASGVSSTTGITPPRNTIHPIVTPAGGNATGSNGVTTIPIDPGTGGKPSAGGSVTVSNGVTKYEITNGPGGVAVYSGKPGTITVTNGKESVTLNGGSVNLSGNVIGVGAPKELQVLRKPNGEATIAVNAPPPPPTPPLPNGGMTDFTGVGGGIFKAVDDFGYGLTHGFGAGPVPPPRTSTTTQQ
jgi:hypothetical protein